MTNNNESDSLVYVHLYKTILYIILLYKNIWLIQCHDFSKGKSQEFTFLDFHMLDIIIK